MTDKLSYVRYDYNDLVRQLQDRLRARDSWKDTYESATGQALIELYAYVANLMLYYVERRTEEMYLDTAQNKSSVINLVQLLNYQPKRNISSVGTVNFSITSAAENIIIIPKHTRITTASNVPFVTITDGTIAQGSTISNNIDIIQGSITTIEAYNSGTTAEYEILVDDTTVENSSRYVPTLNVSVRGILWERVSSFLASGTASNHYVVRSNLDDTISIIFGNGTQGRIPENNHLIEVEYLSSLGDAGNIYEEDRIITVVDPKTVTYTYTIGSIQYTGSKTLSLSSSSLIVGGSDAETVEEIRQEAPAVFKTGDRLVIREDFESFLLNTKNITEVKVWGENEEDPPNYDMFNRVKIALLLKGWRLPPEELKDELSESLYAKSMMTVKYEWIEADIFQIVPVLDVVVNKRFALSTTQAEIESVLQSQFILGSTAKFGVAKRRSNLIEKIDALASVKYLHLTLEILEELDGEESGGIYTKTLISDSIKPETVKIYAGDTAIAVDVEDSDSPPTGAFVSTNAEYTVSGTIDYSTGEVSVEISPAPSEDDVVSVRYQQDNNGDILVGNEGICNLHSVVFDSLVYA